MKYYTIKESVFNGLYRVYAKNENSALNHMRREGFNGGKLEIVSVETPQELMERTLLPA